MPTTISSNGHHPPNPTAAKEPPKISRIVPRSVMAPPRPEPAKKRPQPTQFLEEYEGESWRTTLYNLSRHDFGSTPLTRWVSHLLVWAFLITAAIWLWGWYFVQNSQPAIATLSLLCLAAAMGWGTLLAQLRRQDFVQFTPKPVPDVQPERLSPEDKVPVYVTGQFSVEGKKQRYTYLPGFYRTFATRERALLCQRRSSTFFRFCRWPKDELGMWYIFLAPQSLHKFYWGELHFGDTAQPALAIQYAVKQKSQGLLQREQQGMETVYLVWQDSKDGLRILADLLCDQEKR